MMSAANPLLCPKCRTVIGSEHPYSWCRVCGEPLPQEIIDQLPNSPKGTVTSAPGSEVFPDQHESRAPLTMLGVLCLAIGISLLLNPEAPVDLSPLGLDSRDLPKVVNFQKLVLGHALTTAGAIFCAAAWRPR